MKFEKIGKTGWIVYQNLNFITERRLATRTNKKIFYSLNVTHVIIILDFNGTINNKKYTYKILFIFLQ